MFKFVLLCAQMLTHAVCFLKAFWNLIIFTAGFVSRLASFIVDFTWFCTVWPSFTFSHLSDWRSREVSEEWRGLGGVERCWRSGEVSEE